MYTYNRFTLLYNRKLTQHCKSTILQKKKKKRISVGLIRAELQVKMNFRSDCILFYCHIQEKRAAGSSEDTGKERVKTTYQPACLESVLRNKRGRDSERPAHRDEEWPPLATTRESPHTETKTQHSHK